MAHLQFVCRTSDSSATSVQSRTCGIDHRRTHISVVDPARAGLNSADVIPIFEKMGREGMSERVRRHALGDPRPSDRPLHGSLDECVIDVMPGLFAGPPVDPPTPLWEHELPPPFRSSILEELGLLPTRSPARLSLRGCLLVAWHGVHSPTSELVRSRSDLQRNTSSVHRKSITPLATLVNPFACLSQSHPACPRLWLRPQDGWTSPLPYQSPRDIAPCIPTERRLSCRNVAGLRSSRLAEALRCCAEHSPHTGHRESEMR